MLRGLSGGMLGLDRPLFVGGPVGDGYAVLEGTATTGAASASSHSVNLPSGIQAGDFLLVYIRAGNTNINITPPGDWTIHGTEMDANGTSILICKTASGSEGASISVTFSGARTLAAVAMRFSGQSGYHSTSPANVNTTGDPPELVISGVEKHHYIALLSNRTTQAVTAAPSGFSGLVAAYSTTVGNPSNVECTAAAAFLKAEDDTLDPGVFGGTFSGAHAATAAISPA